MCLHDLKLIQEVDFRRTHKNDPVTNGMPVIVIISPWSKRCRNWEEIEGCDRGILCGFQHLGDPVASNWCAICGGMGHSAMQCTRRGGGNDPTRHKAWYWYRTQDRMMKFLSELTYPTEKELDGTYFYLFPGIPDIVNWVSHRERHQIGIGSLREMNTFKAALFEK